MERGDSLQILAALAISSLAASFFYFPWIIIKTSISWKNGQWGLQRYFAVGFLCIFLSKEPKGFFIY